MVDCGVCGLGYYGCGLIVVVSLHNSSFVCFLRFVFGVAGGCGLRGCVLFCLVCRLLCLTCSCGAAGLLVAFRG